MKKITQTMVSAILAVILSQSVSAGHLSSRLLLSSRMSGGNIIPTAVVSNASGVAGLMLNATRDSLDVNISVTGLSGPIEGIHIHKGDAKTNGDVLFDLSPFVKKNVARTVIAIKNLPTGFIGDLLNSNAYIAVHTSANPGGEIRGQIKLESDINSFAKLDTAQQTSAVVGSAAIGLASFNISLDGKGLEFKLVSNKLSDNISGLHLHKGAINKAGGLLVDLSSLIKGKNAFGSIAIPDSLQNGILASYISSGLVYLNAHTPNNAGGEIRGQLSKSAILALDAILDTLQIVGNVSNANPFGVGVLSLSNDFGTLNYDFLISNTSDTITAAHFHNAARGANGDVALEIPLTGNGTSFSGSYTSANGLSNNLVSEFLAENIYLAIHTKSNPGGEGRAQVSRLAREGYVAEIEAAQIVGTTTGTGNGGGIVSIGRGRADMHYMITVDGLSGELQATHFHKEVKGKNGGVVFEIPFTNNGAFGYITSSSATPFTPSNELQFRKDSIYIALHTAANPGGELRGQFIRNYKPNVIKTGISRSNTIDKSIVAFPNPSTDFINISSKNSDLTNARIYVYDVMGKKVMDQMFTNKIDVSSLQSGLYILSIENKNGIIFNSKLTKN